MGRSQIGWTDPGAWFCAIDRRSMFRRAERIVARLAGLIDAVVRSHHLVEIAGPCSGVDCLRRDLEVLGPAQEQVVLGPNLRLRPRLAAIWPGARGEEAWNPVRGRRHGRCLLADCVDVRLA